MRDRAKTKRRLAGVGGRADQGRVLEEKLGSRGDQERGKDKDAAEKLK